LTTNVEFFFSKKKKKSKEMPNLARQKRLAMALFGVGNSKVWMDPTKMNLLEQAKTRAFNTSYFVFI
jgi:hypothetical protein